MAVKFLVTNECGRLARWLRLMGYDTVLVKESSLPALYRQAYAERRVVLTRNRRIRASCLFRVVHVTSPILDDQLRQLIQELGLAVDEKHLFTRCNLCNVPVEPIEKAQVKSRVPPHVFHNQRRFFTCPTCQRIYWAASHWQRANRRFARLKEEAGHA